MYLKDAMDWWKTMQWGFNFTQLAALSFLGKLILMVWMEDNIKMDHEEIGCGLIASGSVAGSIEHDNKPTGFIQGGGVF